MYKLKTTSVAARFYEWIWKTDVTKFKTMCPYFWKYVLTIIFLPLILLCKGIYYLLPRSEKVSNAFDYIEDSKVADVVRSATKPSRFWDIVGKVFKWAFFIAVGGFCLLMVIAVIVAFWSNPGKGFSVIGAIVVILGIIVGIGYLFDEYDLGYKIGTPFRFIGDMISSLYHNFCPLINWK